MIRSYNKSDNYTLDEKLTFLFRLCSFFLIFEGGVLFAINLFIQKVILSFFYFFVFSLGVVILLKSRLITTKKIIIISHSVLFVVLISCLIDKVDSNGQNSAYSYFLPLSVVSAIVFNERKTYMGGLFPLISTFLYFFFLYTKISFNSTLVTQYQGLQVFFYYFNVSFSFLSLFISIFYLSRPYKRSEKLKNYLSSAIDDECLEVFVQPKYSESKIISGAEVLLRWKHPLKGYISPDVFIPLAEESGMIKRLGIWVIEKSFELLKNIEKCVSENFTLSVNISPLQLYSDNFSLEVIKLSDRYNIKPSQIIFEVTEGVALLDRNEIKCNFIKLSNHGFNWSVDDFGTGYSSFERLFTLPVNEVKIDKSLISKIEINNKYFIIVKNIVGMSASLNIQTVAEGVETDNQFDILKSLGVNSFQGFYLSRPLSKEMFVKLIKGEFDIHGS